MAKSFLKNPPPTTKMTKVLVMFLSDAETTSSHGVRLGSLSGKNYLILENFNDPLDDFNEYR